MKAARGKPVKVRGWRRLPSGGEVRRWPGPSAGPNETLDYREYQHFFSIHWEPRDQGNFIWDPFDEWTEPAGAPLDDAARERVLDGIWMLCEEMGIDAVFRWSNRLKTAVVARWRRGPDGARRMSGTGRIWGGRSPFGIRPAEPRRESRLDSADPLGAPLPQPLPQLVQLRDDEEHPGDDARQRVHPAPACGGGDLRRRTRLSVGIHSPGYSPDPVTAPHDDVSCPPCCVR